MRAIIIGAGKVGYNIAEVLSMEGHEVIVVEKDDERSKIIEEHLDVQVVVGNGASSETLAEAEIDEADLLVAVTESDELNMIACMLAKQYGVGKTVARVRNPEYAEENKLTANPNLGIDLLINPERVTAQEIKKLIEVPEAIDVEYFANGKIQLLELQIKESSPIVGHCLKEIQCKYPFIIVAILRKEKILIPRGDDRIQKDDIVFVIGKTNEMVDIEKFLGIQRTKTRSVIILGGGRIAYYLAKLLEQQKLQVKIIEKNLNRCKTLAMELDSTLVLHGDGTDIDLLKEEGIGDIDTFVALTDDDKLNLLVSLLSKSLGVEKTIAQIRRSDYVPLIERVGIDVAISPRLLTAAAILKFVRRGQFVSIYLFEDVKAEMMEVVVPQDASVVNRKIKDMNFPKGAILGAISRGDQVIIPNGNEVLLPGDQVIIFALSHVINKIEQFFS